MKCVHFSEVCVMKVKTLDSLSSHILKSSVKRATKNLQHCCKTSWIAMLRVLPPNKKTLDKGTQREDSSKPLKHRILKRILVFKR